MLLGLLFLLAAGCLCAVNSAGAWFRGQIVQKLEPYAGDSSRVSVRYLDYGGYGTVPLAHIRQLR